jgi:hypothetical protein
MSPAFLMRLSGAILFFVETDVEALTLKHRTAEPRQSDA